MLSVITTGVVLGLSAGLLPGPMLTLVIRQTLTYGAREGVKIALVPLITDLPIVILSVWVLGSLQQFERILAGVSLAGGLYVAYLGYECFSSAFPDIRAADARPRSLCKGTLTNFLNPHPYLFWLTVGAPLMVSYYEGGAWAPLGFLAVFYILLVGSKLCLALITEYSRRFIRERGYAWLMRLLGVMLLVFSALFLREAYMLFTGDAAAL